MTPCLHVHSATASVQELRPSALRSELAFRALRVRTPPPSQAPGPFPKTSSLGNAAMPRLGSSAPSRLLRNGASAVLESAGDFRGARFLLVTRKSGFVSGGYEGICEAFCAEDVDDPLEVIGHDGDTDLGPCAVQASQQ
jgi:hypothetical protein